jgi:hypothetical protein
MIRDEFSYLLAAKTFASGRLANPAHPEWIHFEAPYIINQPTYVSIYPPGQGLIMAFGQIAAGHPWWGVWLVTGLMCGAICWMLQGWLPPSWALFGAFVAALRFGLLSYWMDSYWGGSLTALGGALAAGALPRLRHGRARYSFVFALGLIVMAVTRPFEGLLLVIAMGGAVLWWLCRPTRDTRSVGLSNLLTARFAAPASIVLLIGIGGLSYYCFRTTGSAVELPYNIFVREYWGARHFIPMQLPPERTYRHTVFQAMDRVFRAEHETGRSVTGYLRRNAERAITWWLFYCGPILTIPLLLGYRFIFDRRLRPLVIVAVIFAVGLSIEVSRMPHYAAPLTAVWIALWTQAARHTYTRLPGRWFIRLVPPALGLVLVVRLADIVANPPSTHRATPAMSVTNWCCVPKDGVVRADIERKLHGVSGRDLVFFEVPGKRLLHFDWVYNEPDIDSSEIIWARSMSAAADATLAARYPDRLIWRIDGTKPIPLAELSSREMATETKSLPSSVAAQ